MTPVIDIEDTSKALHSDGDWHIMPKSVWHDRFVDYDYPHQSIVYHQCRNYWQMQGDDHIVVPPVQYRVSQHELNIPCGHCKQTCPEGLQGLWTLHNFNSLQSDNR